MKSNYSVGIVMRTKNRNVLLRRAIQSVLNQTYKYWHLVIVNDGGNRDELEYLLSTVPATDKQKITVFHNAESLGMEAASNIGIKFLDTELAVIHDDDDSWAPEFLSRMVTVYDVEKHKTAQIGGIVCHSNRVIETTSGNIIQVEKIEPFNQWIPPGIISLSRMFESNMFVPISFLFELDVCKEIGMFNEKLPVLGDWDFHIRFLMLRDIWMLPESLAFYHYRLDAGALFGNSVIEGVDKHRKYRLILENEWIRQDIKNQTIGLGFYVLFMSRVRQLQDHLNK